MVAARKVAVVAGREFPSMAALERELTAIRDRTPRGKDIPPDDFVFVMDCVRQHRDADQKIGCGITAIYPRRCPTHGSTGLWGRRTDGSLVDLGKKTLVAGVFGKNLHADDVNEILRNAVVDQKKAFREERPRPLRCDWLNIAIDDQDAHVHHMPLFSTLRDDWLASEKIGVNDIPVVYGGDGKPPYCPDEELIGRWQAFHAMHGRFYILHRAINEEIGGRDIKNNPELQRVLADMVALARRVFMTPDGNRKEAMRAELLKRTGLVTDARDAAYRRVEECEQWLEANQDDSRADERHEQWLQMIEDYCGLADALILAKAGLNN